MYKKDEDDDCELREWQMIPRNAFLYFPSGDQIKSGQKEKGWRKIFQNGEPYDDFQNDQLKKLNQKLQTQKFALHPWLNKPNILRFLQANKFKISDTCKAIREACAWRKNDFPLEVDDRIKQILNSGAFYFCGRDNRYRPILITNIGKLSSNDIKKIPCVLMVIIEFMINELLIPGQVENYVLILNLEGFSIGMKDTVMKIIQFTSNTYRGRLFSSYLLSMPGLLKFAWDSIATKFVSENTLRKIKISKTSVHEDMWTHIDQRIIEQKFGGKMPNVKPPFWPPSPILMNRELLQTKNQLIHETEYQHKHKKGLLKGRKVQKRLLQESESEQIVKSCQFTTLPQNPIRQQHTLNIKHRQFQLFFQSKDYKNIRLK